MATVLEQLEAMRSVPDNWDGYGGAAPCPAAIDSAVAFWRGLPPSTHLEPPYVTPTRNGGVLFDWSFGPHQLEVEIMSPEKATFVYINQETEETATGSFVPVNPTVRPVLALTAILSAMPATVS